MCEILLTAGACESPTCTFAHTTQELKAAKCVRLRMRRADRRLGCCGLECLFSCLRQTLLFTPLPRPGPLCRLRLGRRIAEEQAKLGWVPLPPEPRPQLPAHEAAGPSSGSGGGAAQLSAKYQAAGKYKKVLCWHYTRNNVRPPH